MTIPTYGAPQVQNAPLEGARVNPGMAPNSMGAIGQGIQNAVAGFQQIQFEADREVAQSHVNSYLEAQNKEEMRLKSLTGEAAVKPDADGKTASEIAVGRALALKQQFREGLGVGAAKLFDHMVDPHLIHFKAQAGEHQRVQWGVFEDQNASANDSLAIKAAAEDPIKERATNKALDMVLGNAFDISESRKYTGKIREAYIQARVSPVVATVVEGLLDAGSSKDAREYLDAARPYLAAKQMEVLDKKLKISSDSEIANSVVMESFDAFATRKPGEPAPVIPVAEVAMNLLQDARLTTPESKEKALRLWENLTSHAQRAWNEQGHAQVAAVDAVRNSSGSSYKALYGSDAGRTLMLEDPTLFRTLEGAYATRDRLERDKEAKLTPQEQFSADALFGDYAFSERLPDVSEAEIRSVAVQLPKELGRQLHSLWMKTKTDQGKYQLKTDQNGLFMVAHDNGLIKGDKPKSTQEKVLVRRLQAVAEALAPDQKVAWTDKTQQAFFTKLINTKVKTGEDSTFFGIKTGEQEIPLFEAISKVPDWFKKQNPDLDPEVMAISYMKAKKAGILKPPAGQPQEAPPPVVPADPSGTATEPPVATSPLTKVRQSFYQTDDERAAREKEREATRKAMKKDLTDAAGAVKKGLKKAGDLFKAVIPEEGA